ncbi:unnamed protein product [Linum tenue]|uniref:Cytochrome P450 n=1 Tax=Linum tenue TaxID=586396 RepID=A0AAV0RNG7_9ROSI|nr:unnamed protein product [Linum tenue]
MSKLIKHPSVMKKLQEEARREAGVIICEENLQKVEYLKLVIKETTRTIAPASPVAASKATYARRDATIMGYDVSAGTMILTNAWGIGRDPHIGGNRRKNSCPSNFSKPKWTS